MEQKIIEQAVKNRQPIPDAIANAPVLLFGLDFYFRAFMDLNTCRATGMGRGPIPWVDLNTYADSTGLAGDDKEVFLYLLQKVDDEYLAWAKTQDEKNKSKQPPKRR